MVNDASNCKKLYSFVKDKKCDSSGMVPLKKDGTTHNDATTKSEILNDQFLSAFTIEDTRSFPDLGAGHYLDAPEITMHPNGVRKLLRNLKPNKATGPDNISPRFLKEMAEPLTPILVLQSSWWGRESRLLCLICLPGVSWWLSGSSSQCHGVVCSLWLWYFLIILTYYFWLCNE